MKVLITDNDGTILETLEDAEGFDLEPLISTEFGEGGQEINGVWDLQLPNTFANEHLRRDELGGR